MRKNIFTITSAEKYEYPASAGKAMFLQKKTLNLNSLLTELLKNASYFNAVAVTAVRSAAKRFCRWHHCKADFLSLIMHMITRNNISEEFLPVLQSCWAYLH